MLVTGAAGGLGRVVSQHLADAGARVVRTDLAGTDGMRSSPRGTESRFYACDISDRQQVQTMLAQAEAEVGRVSGVVANAAFMEMGPFMLQPPEVWWRHVATNLTGTFNVCQLASDRMIGVPSAAVVIVASEWGLIGWPQATAYAASKGGLIALTKTLGRELIRSGVRVNAIAPGIMDTPQLRVDAASAGVPLDQMRQRYADAIPLGRLGKPEEVAACVTFLLSDRSSALVGQILQPNGGTTRVRP